MQQQMGTNDVESWVPSPGGHFCLALSAGGAPPRSLCQDPSSCGTARSMLVRRTETGFLWGSGVWGVYVWDDTRCAASLGSSGLKVTGTRRGLPLSTLLSQPHLHSRARPTVGSDLLLQSLALQAKPLDQAP